jgi:predicted nucleic-acid-binding Zn-ribbon protein
MRKGICLKCGSKEVYQCYVPAYGGGIRWEGCNHINLTTQWSCEPTREWVSYICTNCGYYENYILDRKVLELVKKPENLWVKVNE